MPKIKERKKTARLPEDGPIPLKEFQLGVIYAKIDPFEDYFAKHKLGKATLITGFRPDSHTIYIKRAQNAFNEPDFPDKLKKAVEKLLEENFGPENVQEYSSGGGTLAISGDEKIKRVLELFARSTLHLDPDKNVTIEVAPIGRAHSSGSAMGV